MFNRFRSMGAASPTAILAAISAAMLASCASEPTCDYDNEPYMAAQSVPPLVAPEGLTAPDRSASLVIPPPPPGTTGKPSGKGRCLDRPPSYFSTQPESARPETGNPGAGNP